MKPILSIIVLSAAILTPTQAIELRSSPIRPLTPLKKVKPATNQPAPVCFQWKMVTPCGDYMPLKKVS